MGEDTGPRIASFPHDLLISGGRRGAAHNRNRGRPATSGQLKAIRALGFIGPLPELNMGAASDFIWRLRQNAESERGNTHAKKLIGG